MVVGAHVAVAGPKLSILYKFKGGADGAYPVGGVVRDNFGNLYGATQYGGDTCCGTVYRLTPPASGETKWQKTLLYAFGWGKSGPPQASMFVDPSGALNGVSSEGGGYGTIFRLTPPASGGTKWRERVLHSFRGFRDGMRPQAALIRDDAGYLYGTTHGEQSVYDYGSVFRLTDRRDFKTLYRFKSKKDGGHPQAALAIDDTGALYGTTTRGGIAQGDFGLGTIFKLTPPIAGGTRWAEATLYRFSGGDGAYPRAAVILDGAGALYGTTYSGSGNCGTVFKLTPPALPGSLWTHEMVRQFSLDGGGCNLPSPLIRDASEILYGSTESTVFKLSPPSSGQTTWAFRVLHHFGNGETPSGVVFGPSGELLGTTQTGGDPVCNCGTVFKLVP
jgi:uncharacterized repeat protein (TIGR03803 family)